MQLRKQLKHYNAKVTVRTVWHNIVQWLVAFGSWATYISVRVYYLATGRTAKVMGDPQACTGYSILVITVESVLGFMNLIANTRFTKQEVEFSNRAEGLSTQQDHHVRS
jgi:hypothetical protein